MRTGIIKGPQLLLYYIQRFIVFSLTLRWAMDPDKYDVRRGLKKVYLGLWDKSRLVGGARVIYPENLGDILTFSGIFRMMVDDSYVSLLMNHSDLWIEVTRLYVLGSKNKRAVYAKELFREIYRFGITDGRPFVLMVVNDTLLTMFKRYRFAFKIVGAAGLPPANGQEKRKANDNDLVSHYVIVLDLVSSQKTVSSQTLEFFSEGMDTTTYPVVLGVQEFWDKLVPLSAWEIAQKTSVQPCGKANKIEGLVGASTVGD